MFSSKKSTIQTEQKLQKNFKQLLNRYVRMPVSNGQLYQVYFTYLEDQKMDDEDSRLLEKINQANRKSISSQFKCFMHKVFENLNTVFDKIKSTDDLKQLDKMVLSNAPKFIEQEENKTQISKVSKSSLSKSGFTPGCSVQSQKINEKNKQEIIFGYLFEKIHVLLAQYKEYYQMENVEELETQIYQSFSAYVEENCDLMKKVEKKDSNKEQDQKERKQQVKQKFQEKQKEDKGKSDLVDQLIDVVIENATDAKMIKKTQESEEGKDKALTFNNYEVSPIKIIGNASSFLTNIYKDGLTKTLTAVFHYARQKSLQNSVNNSMKGESQQLAFKLTQTIINTHKRHNLTKDYGLPAEQFKMVEEFMRGIQKDNNEILQYLFTEQEKKSLIEVLKDIIESPEINLNYRHVIDRLLTIIQLLFNLKTKQAKQSSKLSSKKGIKTTLSTINTISQLPNTFYFVVFLYKSFQSKYSPGCRRILTRICHQVQDRFKKMQSEDKQFRRFSLVHTLKLLQGQNTKRSELSRIITNQKPFRESRLPLIHEKKEYFEEFSNQPFYKLQEAQQSLQVELARIHIQEHKKQFKQIPKLQLLKLSHSKYRKTVTILISGFLSEDTNKFDEWMGILQPTYDSQIYALKWESKTIQNILAYTIDTCKDIALAGAGVGLIGGPYFKAAMILKQIVTKYNQNPFSPCFDVATVTGVFLADILISLFDGHFINLAGFSLGTQVIASALHRLKSRGKLHLINRVVTMGGVADKKQMGLIFDSVEQNEEKPIEISWTNVYCQTDNILKYLLRISMPSIDPIGLTPFVPKEQIKVQKQGNEIDKEIKPKLYEIDNINVTEFIDGHLTYRANMKNIARLIGIKDQ